MTTILAAPLGAVPARCQGHDFAQPASPFLGARGLLVQGGDAERPFLGFRARSLELGRPVISPRPEDGQSLLALARSYSSPAMSAIELESMAPPEPRWTPKDVLLTGVPPVENRSHLGEAIARIALGFVVGRAVEQVGHGQARARDVRVRSASDPHGKGVGLKLSASW